VKVFIIDSLEGTWLDCGAGDAQFVVAPEVTNFRDLTPKDLTIVVQNTIEDSQSRDYIPPFREKALRANKSDKKIIFEANLEHAKDFEKCQTTIITWEQSNIEESIAISFLDPWECQDYWKLICTVFKIPFVEDLCSLESDNIKKINRIINEDPDLKAAYLRMFTSNTSAMKSFRDTYQKLYEDSRWNDMTELAKFIEKMILMKDQDFVISLLRESWQATFGALDYHPFNYSSFNGEFRHRYLDFVENQSKLLVPKENISQEFLDQVQLRFRMIFLLEFVMVGHFSEENASFTASIMSSINMPLLDLILSDDLLESIVYVAEPEKYPIVTGFLCEFLGIVKNLAMDIKAEVCKTLRQHSIGSLSLVFLQDIFSHSFEDKQLQKNMVLSHLELLYFSFRRDMEYTKDCFSKTNATNLLEQILLFADNSTNAYFC